MTDVAPAPTVTPTNSGTPNGTVFDQAGQGIDQAKAAALAALAQGGTAGLAAHMAAQQALGSDRAAAIKATLASAQGINAPAGAAQLLSSTVNAPFDQYAATNTLLQNAAGAANTARQGAADTYFKEAAAAVPVVRAQAEAKLGVLRQQAQAAADARAQAASDRQTLYNLQLQAAQDRAAKAAAPQTLAQFIAANGGPDLVGDQLVGAVNARGGFSDPASQVDQVGGGHPAAGVNEVAGPDTVLPSVVAGSPIPPAVARTLVNDSIAKDQQQSGQATNLSAAPAAIRSSDAYKQAEQNILQGLNAGGTYEQFVANLTKNVTDPVLQHQLLADYGPIFQRSDSDRLAQQRLAAAG